MACYVSGISLSSTVATSDVHSAGLGTACARKTRCTVPRWLLYIGAIDFKLYSYNLYSLPSTLLPQFALRVCPEQTLLSGRFSCPNFLLLLLSLLLACATHGQRVNESD